MKFILVLSSLLLANLIHASEIKEEEGVLVLTKANFKEALKNDFILVEFCEYTAAISDNYPHD
jgi:hypothetical protein